MSVGVALAGNKLVARLGGGGLLGKVREVVAIESSAFHGLLLPVLELQTCT